MRVAETRRVAGDLLRAWGLGALVGDAQLLVSELVSNALAYGRGDVVRVGLRREPGRVCIEVDDGCDAARARIARRGARAESGRGLVIVDAVAESWGTAEGGAVTWCVLAVPECQ